MDDIFRQRIIKRRFLTYMAPFFLLALMLINLAWDLIKVNVAESLWTTWPWRFSALDIPTCAALAGITAGLLVSRSQLSRTLRPSLGWRSDDSRSAQVKRSVRTVRVYNSGGGRAVIGAVRYRVSGHGPQGADNRSGWVDWEEAIRQIGSYGLKYRKDFYILMLGAGASIPGSDRTGIEVAAFARSAYARLLSVEAIIQFEDVVGDTYERAVRFLSVNDEYPRSRR